MNKCYISLLTIALITSILFTGCSRKTGDELMSELYEKANASIKANNPDAAIAEFEKALDSKIYEPYMPRLFLSILQMHMRMDQYDDFLANIEKMIARIPEIDAKNICEQAFFHVLENRSKEDTELLIATIKKSAADSKTILARTEVYELHLLAKNNAWGKVAELFKTLAAKQDDRHLSLMLNKIAERAMANSQRDTAATLAEFVIDNYKNMIQSLKTASGIWVKTSIIDEKFTQAQEKITALLLEKKVPVEIAYSQFNRHFHKIIGSNDEATIKNMQELAGKMIEMNSSLEEKLKTSMLDLAFLTENYDEAIRIIELGIPDRPEDWHKQALVKLKAHSALAKGNSKDAINHFREFMGIMKETGGPAEDPTTGIMHTVNMTLGFNSKRIGDIMKDMNNLDGAKKAYKEAEAYYKQAMEEAATLPKSLALIKEYMQELAEAQK